MEGFLPSLHTRFFRYTQILLQFLLEGEILVQVKPVIIGLLNEGNFRFIVPHQMVYIFVLVDLRPHQASKSEAYPAHQHLIQLNIYENIILF